ncbi:MAG: hypothetical protein PVJ84_03260, partial [Desulfobacteraceae bacterium]
MRAVFTAMLAGYAFLSSIAESCVEKDKGCWTGGRVNELTLLMGEIHEIGLRCLGYFKALRISSPNASTCQLWMPSTF